MLWLSSYLLIHYHLIRPTFAQSPSQQRHDWHTTRTTIFNLILFGKKKDNGRSVSRLVIKTWDFSIFIQLFSLSGARCLIAREHLSWFFRTHWWIDRYKVNAYLTQLLLINLSFGNIDDHDIISVSTRTLSPKAREPVTVRIGREICDKDTNSTL